MILTSWLPITRNVLFPYVGLLFNLSPESVQIMSGRLKSSVNTVQGSYIRIPIKQGAQELSE